jgi:WD40 repeat protein
VSCVARLSTSLHHHQDHNGPERIQHTAMGPEEIVHDFGRGFGTEAFEPAILRGKEEIINGVSKVRPLVWGEERLAIELPRPHLFAGTKTPISVSRCTNRVAAGYGEVVSVFEIPDWNRILVLHHPFPISHISFSPDGKKLLTKSLLCRARDEDEIRIWDIAAEMGRQGQGQGQASDTIETEAQSTLPPATSQDEPSWGRRNRPRLAEGTTALPTEAERRRLTTPGMYTEIKGLDLAICAADDVWSPDGSHLLLVRRRETAGHHTGRQHIPVDLITWNVASNEEGKQLQHCHHEHSIYWCAFSPDGKWIASSSYDKRVRIWDVATGYLRFLLPEDEADEETTRQSCAGCFSPDSDYLAVGNDDGYLRIWSNTSGVLEHKLSIGDVQRRSPISGLQFVPDSQSIFYSDAKGNAELYSLARRATEQRYLVDNSPWQIAEVHVSADGKSFGYRIDSGQITVFRSHENELWQVEEVPKGQQPIRQHVYGTMRFLDDKGESVVSYDDQGIMRVWLLAD